LAADPHRFDDLFQDYGRIVLRRMFGGEGIFAGDLMLGLIFDDVIYLKTDDKTRPAYLAEGCKPFTFAKPSQRRTVVSNYYTLPDRLYDEPEELARWARDAEAIVARSKKRKKARQPAGRRA
jgi:DNA transformation protein and related proteins